MILDTSGALKAFAWDGAWLGSIDIHSKSPNGPIF